MPKAFIKSEWARRLERGLTVGGSAASIQGLRPYGDWQSQCAYPVLPEIPFIRSRKRKWPIPSQFPLVFGVRLRSGENTKIRIAEFLEKLFDIVKKTPSVASGRNEHCCASEFNLKESAGGSVLAYVTSGRLFQNGASAACPPQGASLRKGA